MILIKSCLKEANYAVVKDKVQGALTSIYIIICTLNRDFTMYYVNIVRGATNLD